MPAEPTDHRDPSTSPDHPMRMRPPVPTDGRSLWQLAGACALDVNSAYAYVMWGRYHAGTSVVAEDGGGIAGFVLGFGVPETPGTVFVWQIGVAADRRGRGIGGRLLDELVARSGATCIEATVTPSNEASATLFRALAARHGTTATEEPCFDAHLFPEEHEAEVLFRIATRSTTTRRHA